MTEYKILSTPDEIRQWRAAQRVAGRVVVFTNGVFDLLHPGHLDSLRRARDEGDVLIVAINDDESVRRIKGEGRPILAVGQRLRLLAALECVDAVTSFPEDSSEPIIKVVQPDVLVKGGQYTVQQIVGHEFVLDRGGRVLSLPMLPGRSTTNVVGTIKERFV